MVDVICPTCEKTRSIVRVPEGRGLCRPCADDERSRLVKGKGYPQTCVDCPKEWFTKTDCKSTRCLPCNQKVLMANWHKKNRKTDAQLTRYWYFCPTCPSVRAVVSKRKSSYCKDCIGNGRSMQYARICPDCPGDNNFKWVSLESKCGVQLCTKCSNKVKYPEKVKVASVKKVSKPKAKRVKHYSPVGYDGKSKVRVQFQEVDMETFEAPVKKKKNVQFPQSSPEDMARMIAEFQTKQIVV